MTGHGVSPPVAVALATVAFFALLIAGLGMIPVLLGCAAAGLAYHLAVGGP